jgi:hypothetical protein
LRRHQQRFSVQLAAARHSCAAPDGNGRTAWSKSGNFSLSFKELRINPQYRLHAGTVPALSLSSPTTKTLATRLLQEFCHERN